MTEGTLFESERRMDRGEIAQYLRTAADRLDAGESGAVGDRSVTLSPPGRPSK
jgi:amphi-Trp domain-containing protein